MGKGDAVKRGVRHGEVGYEAAIEIQRAGYEKYASSYDRLVGRIVRDRHYRKVMLDGMQLAPGSHVLVVACGAGRDLTPLQERVGPSGRITALTSDYQGAFEAMSIARGVVSPPEKLSSTSQTTGMLTAQRTHPRPGRCLYQLIGRGRSVVTNRMLPRAS